jgi:surface antigen
MQSNGQAISSTGSNLLVVTENAPSYDGQFGPYVAALGQQAYSRASTLAGSIVDLSEHLLAKGIEFETVDMAAIGEWDSFFCENTILKLWSTLTGLSIEELKRYLKLATLLGNSSLFFGIIISILVGQQSKVNPQPSISQAPQADRGKTWTQTEIENQIKEDNHGKLPADDGSQQCVDWARTRREELGATELPHIGAYSNSDLGAHNYVQIYKDSVVQISMGDVSGSSLNVSGMLPGAALVWDKGDPMLGGGDGYTYGHIAIIEAVQSDGVWVSQANWPGASAMFIPKENLSGLYIIPPSATPG